jgi:hypothetical protein
MATTAGYRPLSLPSAVVGDPKRTYIRSSRSAGFELMRGSCAQ